MTRSRLVVLISGSGSNLQAIIDACQNNEVNGEICAVISNKADAYGLVRAQNAGIETAILSHKDYPSREDYDIELAALIDSFNPDLVVLGHADSINLETIDFIKSKKIKICQWFLDPVGKGTPDKEKNKNRLILKSQYLDASFLTTDPNSLDFKSKNTFFIPNPADPSFETLNNYQKDCKNDFFFAMSHGVHRGELKKGKKDDREIFIKKLIKLNKSITFDIYGMFNSQPIWAENFLNKVSNSSMGLNLSRGKPIKYYSSDRIVQLIGNGLLTFIDEKTCLSDFFTNKELIFYKNISDLSEKLNKFSRDKKEGKKIARLGKIKYLKYFNSSLVSEFLTTKTFEIKSKKKFVWEKK